MMPQQRYESRTPIIALKWLGYHVAATGWFFFFVAVYYLAFFGNGGKEAFFVSGCLIVPGWLMLRFAAGLFPFSKRFFLKMEPRNHVSCRR
jgi:hypothetical protein